MKKFLNKKVICFAIAILLLLLFKVEVKAANASISCGNSVEVNTPIKITVNGSGVQWNLKLIVDGQVIATNRELENFESNKNINFSGTYTPTSTGTKTVKLEGSVTEFSDGSTITNFVSKSIVVKEKTSTNNNQNNNNNNNDDEKNLKTENQPVTTAKSQDNSLKALSVNVGTLSPKFSSRTTKYTVDVGEDVTSIKISATKNHSGAKISGTGTKQLQPGKNTFNIDVKAENGSTQTYTIIVNKPELPQDEPDEQPDEQTQLELKLASLFIKSINTDREIADVQLTPEFSAETYNYYIDVEKNIESLTIEALPKEDGTIVEITGNENLVPGENIITIVLKSADGEQTAIYKIIVNKEVESTGENDMVEVSGETTKGAYWIAKYCIPIVVGTAVIAILGIIFAVIEYNYGKKGQNKVKDLEYINYDISIDDEEKKPSKKDKNNVNKKEKGKHF